MKVSARARRHPDRAGDPLEGLVNMFDVGLIICFQVLSYSMIADLVEQSEIKTGRRSEGVFAAATAFTVAPVNGSRPVSASNVSTPRA